ncbi:MAG: hypothetical protein V9G12_06875 [Microthrixaceae bacterium]
MVEIVTAEAVRELRQVVGAEREEVAVRRERRPDERSPRRLDHGADGDIQVDAPLDADAEERVAEHGSGPLHLVGERHHRHEDSHVGTRVAPVGGEHVVGDRVGDALGLCDQEVGTAHRQPDPAHTEHRVVLHVCRAELVHGSVEESHRHGRARPTLA